jgi:SRSO17 transposase
VTWRQGTKATRGNPTAAMTSHFLAIRVRPANRDIPARPEAACPNAGCWPNGPPKPMSPPVTGWPPFRPDTPITGLVRLAKIRWRIEHDYRELKTSLGLDHFEGRSFTGRHRHVTLAALAQARNGIRRGSATAPVSSSSARSLPNSRYKNGAS